MNSRTPTHEMIAAVLGLVRSTIGDLRLTRSGSRPAPKCRTNGFNTGRVLISFCGRPVGTHCCSSLEVNPACRFKPARRMVRFSNASKAGTEYTANRASAERLVISKVSGTISVQPHSRQAGITGVFRSARAGQQSIMTAGTAMAQPPKVSTPFEGLIRPRYRSTCRSGFSSIRANAREHEGRFQAAFVVDGICWADAMSNFA